MSKYNTKFYNYQFSGSRIAADAILGSLFDLINIKSIVDVGCGRGAWLQSALNKGVHVSAGYDGCWNIGHICDNRIEFIPHDLNFPIESLTKYDLAISLEVAEHCLLDSSKIFVDNLCHLSDLVLFGAAVPHQGGLNHINEHWQSYWASHFRSNNYIPFDIIRTQIWQRSDIDFWYKQNTIVYALQGSASFDQLINIGFKPVEHLQQLDLVHPELYSCKTSPRSIIASIDTIRLGFESLLFHSIRKIKNIFKP